MKRQITNIFLTGEIHIGKSTVLKKVLKDNLLSNLKIKGFKTRPFNEDGIIKGYTIEIINGRKKHFAHVNLSSSERFVRLTAIKSEFWCFL